MAKVHERPNRASPSEAASYVEEFDRLEQQREEKLRVLDAEFKQKKRAINKEINADQKSQLDDAKKQGINKGIIQTLAAAQKIKRKAADLVERASEKVDQLEDDDREFAIDIRTALGDDFADLPLGKAAIERDEAKDEEVTTSAVVKAVRDSATDDEWDAASAGRPN